jgi:hypothetical protein
MAEEGANMNDYKDSFMKMASTAFSASKTGWTRAKQVASYNNIYTYLIIKNNTIKVYKYDPC